MDAPLRSAGTASAATRGAATARSWTAQRRCDMVGRRRLSAPRATLAGSESTELDIAHMLVLKLRVSRAEFAAVWAAAERRCHDMRIVV